MKCLMPVLFIAGVAVMAYAQVSLLVTARTGRRGFGVPPEAAFVFGMAGAMAAVAAALEMGEEA